MKYLVFGDVHGNLPALEKLFEVEKGNFDQAICHGDVVNYGPWSNECVDFLDSIPEIVLLKGNHEEAFLNNLYPGSNEVAKAFFNFCLPRFRKKEAIQKYTTRCKADDFIVSHTIKGSYLYPDTDLSKLEIKENYIIGHSHYQFDRKIENHRIINTGSLGQNRKNIDLAEYVLYDSQKQEVNLKSFLFDIEQVIQKMEQEGYPGICLNYYKNKSKIKQ